MKREKYETIFLLIEYENGSENTEVMEHDIDIEGFETIRINKLKTDNFTAIYQAIANLVLPVSAMDIRKFRLSFVKYVKVEPLRSLLLKTWMNWIMRTKCLL